METLLLTATVSAVVSAIVTITVIHREQKYQSKRLQLFLRDLKQSEKTAKAEASSTSQKCAQ